MDIQGIDKNLANLMAYVVQVDGTVSNEEISVFNEFLKGRFPEEQSKAIFDGFVSALKERPLLESVLEDVRDSYGEDNLAQLKFVVHLYELISADGITDRELVTFKTVCSFLSIKDENTDLIASLLIPSYQYEFVENVNRKLSAGEDPERFDLVYPGVNLEWIEIEGRYFVVNIGSEIPVFVGNNPLYKNRIIELDSQEEEVTFEGGCVRPKDLSPLFELKRSGENKTLYYRFTGELVERCLDSNTADFRIETDGPRFRLYRIENSQHSFSLGREGEEEKGAIKQVGGFAYLQLSDSLIINGSFFISGRDLLFPGEGKELALRHGEGSKTHFVIGDSVDQSDIYIDDETEADLLITVDRDKKEGGFEFSLDFKELPYPVHVGDKEFQSGEKTVLTENSTMVVGRNQVFFNTLDGSIQAGEINFHRFEVKNLVYRFPNGNLGIDNVSFAVEKGNLISIMGASGSGKSTLMQLLLGYLSPTSGEVTINDHDFHKNFDTLRNYIGYVPQDDLLMENLTVYENLYYTAKVRLPEKTKREIDYLIDRVLKDLGLQDKKHLSVGSPVEKVLSGGQRKRLNIGLELLADPDLFFLDEPTSGLSSGDSESIIKLLSDLAGREKIVFVVIHQPSSDIFKRFDKLLLLDVGGKLAYFGGAMEGIRYFKQFLPVKDNFIECPSCGNANPEIIFNVLEQKERGKDGMPLFKEKKDFGKGLSGFVRRLLGKPMIVQEPVRRYDPDYWSRLFLTRETGEEKGRDSADQGNGLFLETSAATTEARHPAAASSAPSAPIITALPPKPRRNLITSMKVNLGYFSRNLRDKVKDRSNMMMTLLVPLILGLLMSLLLKGGKVPYLFAFNDEYTKYLFLSVVIFIFFGLMASVNEVIRDRPILHREKIIGTKPRQYLFSKIGVYAIFAALQVTLYALPGFMVLGIPWRMPAELAHIPSSFYSLSFFPYFLIAGFLTIYASFALGLFLSSMVKSQLAAFNIIPLIIVPQIIFGGMFVQFADMPGMINRDVPAYTNLTFSRWGYEALLSGSEVYNPLRLVTDAKIIKEMQESYKAVGKSWDYREIISGPLRSMKETPAGPIPKSLSYPVFEEHFKEYISENDPDLWDRGKTLFTLNDTGDFVYLPENPSEEETALLNELFRRAAPDGFYNKYQLFQGNRNVRQAIFDSRSLDWLNKLSSSGTYHPRDWIVGQNVFPAHDKILGPYRFSTVWFNLGVLVLMSLLLHIAAAWKLKRL